MANIFFNGEKATKDEAINLARSHIENYSDCTFQSKVVSDDGGHILQVMVEVPIPAQDLLLQVPDFPLMDLIPKWHGWRTVILKVPPTYISVVVNGASD